MQTTASLPRGTSRILWCVLLAVDALLLVTLERADQIALAAAAILVIGILSFYRAWTLAAVMGGMPVFLTLFRPWEIENSVYLFSRLVLVGLILTSAPGSVRRLLFDPIFLGVVAVGLVLAAGLLWTPSPGYGASKTLFYLANNALLFLAAAFSLRVDDGHPPEGHRRIRRFFASLLVFQLIVAVLGLVARSDTEGAPSTRLGAAGLNPIWLARHTGLGILAALALWRVGRMPVALFFPLCFSWAGSSSRPSPAGRFWRCRAPCSSGCWPPAAVPGAGASFWRVRQRWRQSPSSEDGPPTAESPRWR